jgi:hypothetical protein
MSSNESFSVTSSRAAVSTPSSVAARCRPSHLAERALEREVPSLAPDTTLLGDAQLDEPGIEEVVNDNVSTADRVDVALSDPGSLTSLLRQSCREDSDFLPSLCKCDHISAIMSINASGTSTDPSSRHIDPSSKFIKDDDRETRDKQKSTS